MLPVLFAHLGDLLDALDHFLVELQVGMAGQPVSYPQNRTD